MFILLSIGILTQSNQGMTQVVTHLSGHGGFFPNGFSGVWIGVIISIFSYLSIEMIAVAAGEAKDPKRQLKSIQKHSTSTHFVLFIVLIPNRYFGAVDCFDWSRCNKPFCYGHEDCRYPVCG